MIAEQRRTLYFCIEWLSRCCWIIFCYDIWWKQQRTHEQLRILGASEKHIPFVETISKNLFPNTFESLHRPVAALLLRSKKKIAKLTVKHWCSHGHDILHARGKYVSYHLHSTSPLDLPLTPLYGLYSSPVIFSWSTLRAEKLCWLMSNLTRKARDGRGCFNLSREELSGSEHREVVGVITYEDTNEPRSVKLDEGGTAFISHWRVWERE